MSGTPQVLVLTHWFDPTADSVVAALAERGASVFRCDAADFPQRLVMTAAIGECGWTGSLRTERRAISINDVTGAYYRRPSRWEFAGGMSTRERAWAASEARFGFGGLLSAALPWLNHPVAARQVLTLAEPSGDPLADRLAVASKTTTTRATDRDGSRPSTPKDFNTDSD